MTMLSRKEKSKQKYFAIVCVSAFYAGLDSKLFGKKTKKQLMENLFICVYEEEKKQ